MSFHLYRIAELYSNASGTLQFVELAVGNSNGESFWSGVSLTASAGGATHRYTFATNLPSSATANTTVLVATAGFAAAAGVTPDFVLPDGFLFAAGGTLDFGGVDVFSHGALPTAAGQSLQRSGATGAATPRNFAGVTGTLAAAPATLTGTAGDDTLVGTSADETLEGGAGNDVLHGGGGRNVLRGGDGDDTLQSGSGDDQIDGGTGFDYLYFPDASAGVQIDLRSGTATGGAGRDTLAGVELVFGTPFADTFFGNDSGVGFLGGDGNDSIIGGAATDHLEGNGGDDTIDGLGGVDRVAYYSAAGPVDVDLTAGRATGGLGNDVLRNIEDVVGSVFGDQLKGTAGDNRLEGADGDDRFIATNGNDLVDGGAGLDLAVYPLARSVYTVRATTEGRHAVDKPDAAGTDLLLGVERLQFADRRVALDLDGHAGQVAKLLGAVFGAEAVHNMTYVGIGLGLSDGGMGYEALAAFAVQATGRATPASIVELLWTNVVGSPPSPEQAAPFIAMLAGGTTVGALAVLAADHELNTTRIDLAGLAQTGLDFVPS